MSLTFEIVKHIFARLGIDNNLNKYYASITDSEFLIDKKLVLVDGDTDISNNIWSAKAEIGDISIKLMIASCSLDNSQEHAMVIHMDNSPIYGCYFGSGTNEANIFVNISEWVDTTIFMQASLLAGMEQIKELNIAWSRNDDYDELYSKLVSFIESRDSLVYA